MRHIGTQMLTTKRLTLRRFTIEDAEGIYYNWAGDPEVTKYLTWTAHKSVEESEELIKNLKAGYEKDSYYMWAIELNENEQPIGCIGASGIQEEIDAVELAFFLGKDYWHQGYTTEALTEVVRFFFEEVGANRIWCTHDTENIYSGKAMQACGFTLEGICKKAGKTNNGIADIAIYAVLKQAQDDEEEEEVFEPADTTVTKVVAEDGTVKNVISDDTMEYVGILAKLELNEEESKAAKKDMEEMLDYIDQLNELDTTGVEPMSHVFPVQNVFREDVVTNGDGSADTLSNAPQQKDGGFKVPKTIGE